MKAANMSIYTEQAKLPIFGSEKIFQSVFLKCGQLFWG
jgi:hypothetical protein